MDRLPWIVIAVLLVYIVFLHQCRGPDRVVEPGETVVHTDTVRVTQVDTVYHQLPADTIRLPVRVPVEVRDTVRVYRESFSDTLISGEVWVKTSGYLVDWGFSYMQRQREILTRDRDVITRVVTVPQFIQQPGRTATRELLLGGGMHVSAERQSFELTAGFGRGDYKYLYRYDPLFNMHGVSVIRAFSW